ncbi:Hypothetical_protein [Hexamita inflata]|uniref:Hypothetical_protein n=1 Tax=Hexamita inflata TaxID=28002 RepID=A0AA86R258_9EUKA|nr:Hypothetical protein HINF_LOCUS52477 [Hexamita inflata]
MEIYNTLDTKATGSDIKACFCLTEYQSGEILFNSSAKTCTDCLGQADLVTKTFVQHVLFNMKQARSGLIIIRNAKFPDLLNASLNFVVMNNIIIIIIINIILTVNAKIVMKFMDKEIQGAILVEGKCQCDNSYVIIRIRQNWSADDSVRALLGFY